MGVLRNPDDFSRKRERERERERERREREREMIGGVQRGVIL